MIWMMGIMGTDSKVLNPRAQKFMSDDWLWNKNEINQCKKVQFLVQFIQTVLLSPPSWSGELPFSTRLPLARHLGKPSASFPSMSLMLHFPARSMIPPRYFPVADLESNSMEKRSKTSGLFQCFLQHTWHSWSSYPVQGSEDWGLLVIVLPRWRVSSTHGRQLPQSLIFGIGRGNASSLCIWFLTLLCPNL